MDLRSSDEMVKALPIILPLAILQGVAFFGIPALFIVLKYGKRLRDIGLPPLPRARDWWAGILLGLVLMVVNLGLEAGLTALAKEFRHVPWVAAGLRSDELQPIGDILKDLPRYGVGMLLLAVLAIGVSAGLGEEMLFRGFFFNALKRRLGLVAGLVLSGLLFSVPHMYFIGFLPVALMGIALAWVYHVSGSLWIPVILHATNNTVLVLLAYFFPEAVK
jgi:membrane protease YdiL (CAAX protease family)